MSPDRSNIIFDPYSDNVLESGTENGRFIKSTLRIFLSYSLLTKPKTIGERDGKRILFLGRGLNNTGYELFVMNADGSALTQLTDKNN